ncbi:MAG: hypothetical protein AB7G37_20570 [Solirubrobacteraceae bacterium]
MQHEAVRTEATAQRALYAGSIDDARDRFARAIDLYRDSYDIAPPGATGRLIGLLKAGVIAGTDDEALAHTALARIDRSVPPGPPEAYAEAIAALIARDDDAAARHTPLMREGSPAFGRTADAIDALASRDAGGYATATLAIVADFESRHHHVTKVAIADTALMLERFAERRGLACRPHSALLPALPPDRHPGSPAAFGHGQGPPTP